MNLAILANKSWYSDRPPWWLRLISILLIPISCIYALVMYLRRRFFYKNLKRSYNAPVPVISVGNLTLGGSSKTPVVAFLAKMLFKKGNKVGVLCRGYQGSLEGQFAVVSDGNKIHLNPGQAGDEPAMLAGQLEGIKVFIGADRAEAAKIIADQYDIDCILLDDGFQHLALARDVDVICVNGALGFGNKRVFPSGPLREPLSSCKDARIVFINSYTEMKESIKIELNSAGFRGDVFKVPFKTRIFRKIEGKEVLISDFKDKKGIAFCSVAHPDSFFSSLQSAGFNIDQTIEYPDHYSYTSGDIDFLSQLAKEKGLHYYVTTEKDAVKLVDMGLDFIAPLLVSEVFPDMNAEDIIRLENLLQEVL